MDTVFLDALPEARGRDLAERMGVIVAHHLRHAGRAGGEIEQHGIRDLCGVVACRTLKNVALLGKSLRKVNGVFRDMRTEYGKGLHGWALRQGVLAVLDDVRVVHRDEHFHARRVQAINEVVRGELEGGGDDHRADFM